MRYGTANGFGFQAGDVAGIISVRLPARSFWREALTGELAIVIAAFLISMLFVRFAIVRPVKRLTAASHEVSLGHDAELGLAGIRRNSRNEIHQLALAIDRLRRSVQIAMGKLGEDQPSQAAPVGPGHDR